MTDALRISKLDAAQRQLDYAIRLWFSEADPVVIHTLACAAFQVIQDLNAKKGNKEVHLAAVTKQIVKPEYVNEAVEALRKPMNFFKHADRDHDEVLEFHPQITIGFFAFSLTGLESLGEGLSDLQRAFVTWLVVHKPNWIGSTHPLHKLVQGAHLEDMRKVDKPQFLEAVLGGFTRARLKTP